MMARKKPLDVLAPFDTTTFSSHDSYTLPKERESCRMVDADNMSELVELLRNEAKVI